MDKKITGSHLLIAVANTNFEVALSDKIKTIAELIQPGFTYEELIEIITKNEVIPLPYLKLLEDFGIKLPTYNAVKEGLQEQQDKNLNQDNSKDETKY